EVTRRAGARAAEHVLRGRENATERIGRSLTVQVGEPEVTPALAEELEAAGQAHPELLAEITARSPGEPFRAYLLYAARRLRATRVALPEQPGQQAGEQRDRENPGLASPGPADSLAARP